MMDPNEREPTEPVPPAPEVEAAESGSTAAVEPAGRRRYPWVLAGVAATVVTLVAIYALAARVYVYETVSALSVAPADGASTGEAKEQVREIQKIQDTAKRARRSVRALAPRSLYIVVDTSENRLYVKRGEETLLQATCSTGSGGLLKDPDTGRQWIFDTPRGRFQVIRKREDPVWTKPDWAFVEEGKPVPEKWSERRDYETLGEYALDFGDGYMIHGTLYQRYLGQNITHGCVRLGDDDLERVYRMTPLGAPILIF